MVPCSGFQSRRGSRCSSGRTPQALRAHGALSAFVQPPLVPQNSSLTAPPELLWPHLCPQITHSQLPQSSQYCPVVPSVFLWPHLCPKIVLSQLPQSSCGSSCPVAPLVPPNSSLTAPSEPPVLSWGPQCCPVVPNIVLLSPVLSCSPHLCPHISLSQPLLLPQSPFDPKFYPQISLPSPHISNFPPGAFVAPSCSSLHPKFLPAVLSQLPLRPQSLLGAPRAAAVPKNSSSLKIQL